MKRATAQTDALSRVHRRGGPVLAALVLVVGLAATALTTAALRAEQAGSGNRVMDQRSAAALAAVGNETGRYQALTEALAAGIGTDDVLTREDFDQVSGPLASAGLHGASAVAYVVPASTAEVPALQAAWRSRGQDDLVLRPRGTGEHYFTIFSRQLGAAASPAATGAVAATGLDLSAAAESTAALRKARQLGQPTVSDPYVLLRDRGLPGPDQQKSFVFASPVSNDGRFAGWVVLGLRSEDFLGGVMDPVSGGQLDAELRTTTTTVASYTVPGRPTLRRSFTFSVADRQWTLNTGADPNRLAGAHSQLPLAVLLGGLFVTVTLAGLVYVLATGRARAWARVQAATASLREAEAESSRQAALLGAVMASLGDGVGVVDASGEFLLHNPAAQELLGVGDALTPQEWQTHYGLFRPDGRTPFPLAEMPLMRALDGEQVNGVEMVVRNPQRPEGLLISVDGRPLSPEAGRAGAVAVFHDITDLRRYENDLAVFAGVVAHDLKSPLAIVHGHCEAACEELAEAGESAPVREARTALTRIRRAVDRMADLIDTLLAYSTARDAPLRTAAVPLGDVVADVIQDRTSHLPHPSRPDVYVGPLPSVEADAAMLRHVVDNLVGNALKYVRPGTAARVDITATPGPDPRWIRISVADRGIGIPDDDKPAVFDTFHRAEGAAEYAGTGLGLAICKRIVERHGGEIGVEDNPGGGTRFFFTVPLCEEESDMNKDEEAAIQAALDRALAERANMENYRLPGLSALPAADPSAHEEPAARLRAPVPDHQHPHGTETATPHQH